MAKGDDDDEAGEVLSPDELDITEDERVAEIDENRFVVSPGDPIDESVATEPDDETPEPETDLDQKTRLNADSIHEWLAADLASIEARYGFDVTATLGDSAAQRRFTSNDVVTTFEALLLWAADQVDDETPVDQVLGILLVESNVAVQFPADSVRAMLDTYDLDPEDSIADLVAASEGDGLVLPPTQVENRD
jgi:hypothetical protein